MSENTTAVAEHGDSLDGEELRELIAEVIDVDVREVTDDADFVQDLEVDSLLALEITVRLEKRYGIRMTDDELASSVTTFSATRELVLTKLAARK
ncbi:MULTISPECIES: acyl carrier protein [Amycolatopsis]|uniref:Acyl carrier protein n=1 Tax=Amycolatopsis albidoflavus TaxID=102226 RepID=A0ABW5I795_9PSEU